jgi:transcriptional regulator with XRE-family HTH domain
MGKSNSFSKLVGRNIRRYRLKRGLTQEKLSFMLKTSNEYISFLENGYKDVRIETLCRIGKALDVEPYLFLIPPKPKKNK